MHKTMDKQPHIHPHTDRFRRKSNHEHTATQTVHKKKRNRVFAIHQILLGWKTCKYYYETDEYYYETDEYYYETDELPNPRPTQPKKKYSLKTGIWTTFSPQQTFFRGLGSILCRKQTTRNLTHPDSLQTPEYTHKSWTQHTTHRHAQIMDTPHTTHSNQKQRHHT